MRFALPSLLLSLAASAAPLQRTTIAEGFHDPLSIAVAGDGDVYLVEREGRLFRIRPDTGGVFQIGSLAVSALRAIDPKSNSAVEDGLQGIALDPGFAQNQRLYLFYSVPTDLIDRLSRFTADLQHKMAHRIMNHIQILFEARSAAVIGVGNIEVGVFAAE